MPSWSVQGRALPEKQRSGPFTGLGPAEGLPWSVTLRELGGLCTPEGATPGREHHARTWAVHQGGLDRLGSNPLPTVFAGGLQGLPGRGCPELHVGWPATLLGPEEGARVCSRLARVV